MLPLAERIDGFLVRRNSVCRQRRSRFATSAERDEFVELAQTISGDGARPLLGNCCAPGSTRTRELS
jgi:hypothetical protein